MSVKETLERLKATTSFYDYKKDGISQSILAGFLKCRKFSGLHLDGWGREWGGYALAFGSFFHEVKGILYTRGKLPSRYRIRLEVNRYKLEHEIKDKLLIGVVTTVLLEYFRFYKKDFQEGKWIGMESEFAIDFLGYKKLMRGKRDGLRKIHGKLWLLETKTKMMINAWQIVSQLPIDFQCNLYMWATWKEKGKVPAGVIYDIIRNPSSKPTQKESVKEFCGRLKGTIRNNPDHYFIRYESPIEKRDLVSFERQLKRVVRDFIAWREGKLKTYMNPYACLTKFGMCHFIDICANGDYSKFTKRKKVHNELEAK